MLESLTCLCWLHTHVNVTRTGTVHTEMLTYKHMVHKSFDVHVNMLTKVTGVLVKHIEPDSVYRLVVFCFYVQFVMLKSIFI